MSKRKSKPKSTASRHLLIRYGGLGDSLFLTCVARQLKKNGITPDIAIPEAHCAILKNNTDIGLVFPLVRVGPWNRSQTGPVNLYRDKEGTLRPTECLLELYKGEDLHNGVNVTDYFRVIEGNGCHPSAPTGNSDFTNTYDLHLGWAGIDPELVPDAEKRSYYSPTETELEWARNMLKNVARPVVLWQPHASAPARSYYRAVEDATRVEKEHGGFHLMWDKNNSKWMHHTGAIDFGKLNPLRATAALIAESDLLVSADTFVSHLAEAVGIKHITWYTTVSAWTRSKYYRNEITYDLHPAGHSQKIPCKCHVITDARCPRVEMKAVNAISDSDKAFLNTLPPQTREAMRLPTNGFVVPAGTKGRTDLHPDTVPGYVQGIAQMYNVARHAEPLCMKDFNLADEVLKHLEAK